MKLLYIILITILHLFFWHAPKKDGIDSVQKNSEQFYKPKSFYLLEGKDLGKIVANTLAHMSPATVNQLSGLSTEINKDSEWKQMGQKKLLTVANFGSH